MRGRPTRYTEELSDEICARIVSGQTIRTICSHEHMPCIQTMYNWLRTNKDFLEQYARAKEDQADALAEEMLDIADDATNDWMKSNGENSAEYKLNGEHVQRSKLRIDTRKWLASKFKAKKYGDSTQIKHADADGDKLTGLDVSIIPSKHTDT